MKLSFTEEQTELRRTVRRLISDRWGSVQRRTWLDGTDAYDRALWTAMAGQIGLNGLSIPEEYGGLGYGFAEQSVVLEEIGRELVATPYLSSAVVAPAVLLGGSRTVARRWLPGIADGGVVAALAHTEADADWRAARPATTATRAGDGWSVSGTKEFVIDGAQADLLLVTAADAASGELVLLAVPAADPAVTRVDRPTLDLTRRLATLVLAGAPAELIAQGQAARDILDYALDVAAIGIACEQAGGCAAALSKTVDYVKVREQFDAPIGSFQAVKFSCADMLLQVEAARSAAYYAAAALDAGSDEVPVSAAVAKAVCSEAFMAVTGSMIQLHGGIGYTWEHEAHLYFKRAKASQHLFGDADAHRDRLADLLGI